MAGMAAGTLAAAERRKEDEFSRLLRSLQQPREAKGGAGTSLFSMGSAGNGLFPVGNRECWKRLVSNR
ncbi:hypothetical protein Pyn_26361 [Prunus yedoensis var. nudiflora]|uniref:Uncharacterized protein n=1 Tax=Prunus yedoensis var. nudiflora TaxID=2094558 RepID=A0A314ZLE2_PRUYE|nr:hypothetical protein Pyn_26361 [Prunus yedoensis var. nudiflora]